MDGTLNRIRTRLLAIADELRDISSLPRTSDEQRNALLIDAQSISQAVALLDDLSVYKQSVRETVKRFRQGDGVTTSDIFKAVEA